MKRIMIIGIILMVLFAILVMLLMYMIENLDFYEKVYNLVHHSAWGKVLFRKPMFN